MTGSLEVSVELTGRPLTAGVSYFSERNNRLTSTFSYDPDYLGSAAAFALDPGLPLFRGNHAQAGLPGSFGDAAPDRWGRNLIQKRDRAEALRSGRPARTLNDVDYLLGVSDLSRQGALRFRRSTDEPFLADHGDVPKVVELPKLLHAAEQVDRDDDEYADVKMLLDAGSGSLGGARPKASVRDGAHLSIAKFPHQGDQWDVMAWEQTALDLAERAGLAVPVRRLVPLAGGKVLLLRRFDRDGERRIPYISAMTLMQSHDGAAADYVDLAETFSEYGAAVRADLRQLWQRMAFSVAINNTDDHLRNHGLLRERSGWRLSPIFDVNPNPDPAAARVTSIAGATRRQESLDGLLMAAPTCGLTAVQATEWLNGLIGVIDGWRRLAAANGVSRTEIERFAPVFDHWPRAIGLTA